MKKMFEILHHIFESIIYSIYIGILVYCYLYAFCKPTIENLIDKTNSLENKQEILHQAIQIAD